MESEEPVHRHLAELFGRIGPDCVLDVGANTGQYAALLRRHGYRGWIVSFEPVHNAFEELARHAARDERWRAFPLALGSRPERRQIAVAEISQLSSFRRFTPYAASELPGASELVGGDDVPIRTLNDSWEEFLRDLPQSRVFLKVDTQGWDLEVLRGASDVVDHLVGIQIEAALKPIYAETPSFAETVDEVMRLGFDLTGVFPVNRDSLMRVIEVDCVLINPRHPVADTWREATWAILTARFRDEVLAAVPGTASFVLIDDASLGVDELEGRRAIPFLQRDGEYDGAPEDGDQAVSALQEQTRRGVTFLAVAWPSFWWLDEYPELATYLRTRWRRVTESDAAVVFELEPSPDS